MSDEQPTGVPDRIVALLRREIPLIALDLATVIVAYLIPLVLRFDGNVPTTYWNTYWGFIPVIGVLHLLSNYLFGLYGEMWRYASVQEARRVMLSGCVGGLLVLGTVLVIIPGTRPVPASVLGLGALLTLMGFGAVRFQSRLFGFHRRYVDEERRHVLIVGAGHAGSMLLKDILRDPSLALEPVAFLDDDPHKIGRSLHGVPVAGSLSSLTTVIRDRGVDEVLLAIPSATSDLVRRIASVCEETDTRMRILPSVRDTVSGHVTVRDVRDVSIEDILGRQQVQTDLESVDAILHDRCVLITGAGGSIGSEIALQAMKFGPSRLILLDHDETHLHDVSMELNGSHGVEYRLADIRDRQSMIETFLTTRPEIVFHAAAHKHVPILETHPQEALFTNILGTANVADAAVTAGVKRFVLISTDKAVKPASVMGASKWFAEQIIWTLQGNGCSFCAVRFGNVLGSRGSVIPTFFRQISKGGPVTVTDPSMTRYFMSVREAVQLVLQAAALSDGGEVFTLDMGEPVNILDLARDLIRLSGRIPGKDIDISIVGTRPGEKLFENVVDAAEELVPSAHPSIVVSRPNASHRAVLGSALRNMESLALQGAHSELEFTLKNLAGHPLAALETAGAL